MILTDNKIQVTMDMVAKANMTRGQQIGVPVDPANKNKGLRWTNLLSLSEADFDAIEEYFINKNKSSDIISWAKAQKEKHELPNDNSHEYNYGYVKAMNHIINYLAK